MPVELDSEFKTRLKEEVETFKKSKRVLTDKLKADCIDIIFIIDSGECCGVDGQTKVFKTSQDLVNALEEFFKTNMMTGLPH